MINLYPSDDGRSNIVEPEIKTIEEAFEQDKQAIIEDFEKVCSADYGGHKQRYLPQPS